MNNKLLGFLAAVLVVVSVGGYFYPKYSPGAQPATEQTYGGIGQSGAFNPFDPVNVYNGFTANKTFAQNYASATTSSTTIVSTLGGSNLGAATAGFLAIPANTLIMYASSSAVDANSMIKFAQIASATAPSLISELGATLCNTNIATSTPMYKIFASTTKPSISGFSVTVLNAPSTPYCYSYNLSN